MIILKVFEEPKIEKAEKAVSRLASTAVKFFSRILCFLPQITIQQSVKCRFDQIDNLNSLTVKVNHQTSPYFTTKN